MAAVDLNILISTRNRAARLAETLESLGGQRLDGVTREIIVVDNGSSDDTPRVLESAKSRLPIVGLFEPRPGKCRALNLALKSVRGDLVVFTDDDVRFEPDWLARLHAASLKWADHSIFCGPIIPIFPDSTPEWMKTVPIISAVAFSWFDPEPGVEGPLADDLLPFGPNYAVRSSALRGMEFRTDLGPSDDPLSPLGDETEFLTRLCAAGHRIVHVPDAKVEHFVRESQLEKQWLLDRAFRFGRGLTHLFEDPSRRPVSRYPLSLAASLLVMNGLSVLRPLFGPGARFLLDARRQVVKGRLFEHRILSAKRSVNSK